jgi:NADPH-dependent curcumin reductase CurA
MAETYRRIVLASRPKGWPESSNFRIETRPLEAPAEGQVLVRIHYMSLDPYMRGRMNETKSYAAPQPLNETMQGGAVGEIVASRHSKFAIGDKVRGPLGWTEYALSDGTGLTTLDTTHVPLSAYLGCVGMPGMTAWYGYYKILMPKPHQTVVVSAASGAVGGVVGQLAKFNGARAIGIAGGPQKCHYVTEELGFDACIDYREAKSAEDLLRMLRSVAPEGVDCHFENVGGDVLNAVIAHLNPFARVAICGLIADYNNEPGQSARSAILNPGMFLVSRFTMRGFIVSDHLDLWPTGLAELAGYVASGRLKYRESIAAGLETAPEAFIGLLKGKNFGKQLVKLV